ncbi:MAG: hypothetical protein VYB54_04420 [Pseudomonadota bacterium]|nr:hypothetical protein [Pseudomonadota bacterium]
MNTTTAPKMNSRMGEARPDIDHDGPLRAALEPLLDGFADGRLDATLFQQGLVDALGEIGVAVALGPAILSARQSAKDVVIWRKDFGGRDVTVSIIHLDPGEVHPPHHHHNVTSVQMVLEGQIDGREYERVERIDESTVLLRPVSNGPLPPGTLLLAHEWSRNVHWFAAGEEGPALIFNCNARGFERTTFDPSDGRALGRRLIDPTGDVRDGLIAGREVDVTVAYGKFGGRPLGLWPLPLSLAGPPPPLRADLLI